MTGLFLTVTSNVQSFPLMFIIIGNIQLIPIVLSLKIPEVDLLNFLNWCVSLCVSLLILILLIDYKIFIVFFV